MVFTGFTKKLSIISSIDVKNIVTNVDACVCFFQPRKKKGLYLVHVIGSVIIIIIALVLVSTVFLL